VAWIKRFLLSFLILLVVVISIYVLSWSRNTQIQNEMEEHNNLTAQEVIEIYFGYLKTGDGRALEMMLERGNQSNMIQRVRQIEIVSIDEVTDIDRFDWFFTYVLDANDFYEVTFWDVLYMEDNMIHDW